MSNSESIHMNNDIAHELMCWISENLETESAFLNPSPNTSVSVIPLLDKIADMRGIDKKQNGLEFNEICDKRDSRAEQ